VVVVWIVGAVLGSFSVACADGILVVRAVGCIFVGVVERVIVSVLGAVDLLAVGAMLSATTGTLEDDGLVVTLESVGDNEMLLGGSVVGSICIGEMEGAQKGVELFIGAPAGAS